MANEPVTVAVTHPLRVVLAACFLPAFPLCVAHGVLSNSPVPAVGLVPQAASVITSLLLLRLRAAPPGDAERQARPGTLANDEPTDDANDNDAADDDEDGHVLRDALAHPITVFAVDSVLAASYMIVLVFTWIEPSRSPSLSMLAAYATMPLLTSL